MSPDPLLAGGGWARDYLSKDSVGRGPGNKARVKIGLGTRLEGVA